MLLNIIRMEHGEKRDLSEVIFLIERQNLGNTVVFHDDAVNYVPDSRVIPENALFHVTKKNLQNHSLFVGSPRAIDLLISGPPYDHAILRPDFFMPAARLFAYLPESRAYALVTELYVT